MTAITSPIFSSRLGSPDQRACSAGISSIRSTGPGPVDAGCVEVGPWMKGEAVHGEAAWLPCAAAAAGVLAIAAVADRAAASSVPEPGVLASMAKIAAPMPRAHSAATVQVYRYPLRVMAQALSSKGVVALRYSTTSGRIQLGL
ncbi:hypothetical protein ACSFA7_18435 [Variovorax sp. LT1R20]|uniref:hypothetical protein n=1 Tax=Variovorax sp. LT1R20 TaxID=3443729 RepID=UPI003F4832AF